MPMPVRTAEQRRVASAQAVTARRRRAEACAALKRGHLDLITLLERAETDPALAGLRVYTVLLSLPRFGPLRADRALVALEVSGSRRLRGLGRRQRERLQAFGAVAAAARPS